MYLPDRPWGYIICRILNWIGLVISVCTYDVGMTRDGPSSVEASLVEDVVVNGICTLEVVNPGLAGCLPRLTRMLL